MKQRTTIGVALAGLVIGGLSAGKMSAQVVNPGFEIAGASSTIATNWNTSTAAGGPVYGIRTNDNPNTVNGGSWNYQVHLASVGAGPVVEFMQGNVPVIGGATYTLAFYSDRLTGSAGDSDQYNIRWLNSNSVVVAQTGYTSYSPGANAYAQKLVNGLVAPVAATQANIFFHCAGAAITNQSATIDFDDVSLTTTNVVTGPTNHFQISAVQGAGISWFASNGVSYQVQWASTPGIWNNLGNRINGNGSSNTVFDPAGESHNFYRVLSIQ